MKALLLSGLCLLAASKATGQNTGGQGCPVLLNDVPAVADSSAGVLYFCLPPDSPADVTGVLSSSQPGDRLWLDYRSVHTPEGTRSVTIANWRNRTHRLTHQKADGTRRLWLMEFTTLPLVCIDTDMELLAQYFQAGKRQKGPGCLTLIDPLCQTDGTPLWSHKAGMRIRGASSGYYPKKSLAVEFRDEQDEEAAVSLLGINKESDWVLDAMYIDRARMRNRVLTDIWNEMEGLPYARENEGQGNGTQGRFVEVFVNGSYNGLYCLTDKINRKKLNLKKTQTGKDGATTHRGLLYKGRDWSSATMLLNYSDYASTRTLKWEGWEQKYPDDSPQMAFWQPMKTFIATFCSERDSPFEVFEKALDELCYLDNVIDYIILIHAFNIEDNQMKNTYFSIQDIQKNNRMLITPWDMDASFGRSWNGNDRTDAPDAGAFGGRLYRQSGFFYRLLESDPAHFRQRLHDRWNELRMGVLDDEAVARRLQDYASLLNLSGAWKREKQRWPETIGDLQEEMDFCTRFYTRNATVFEDFVKDWPATPVSAVKSQLAWSVEPLPNGLRIHTPEPEARAVLTDLAGRIRFATDAFPATCTGLGKGIYLIQFTAGRHRETQKITLP